MVTNHDIGEYDAMCRGLALLACVASGLSCLWCGAVSCLRCNATPKLMVRVL